MEGLSLTGPWLDPFYVAQPLLPDHLALHGLSPMLSDRGPLRSEPFLSGEEADSASFSPHPGSPPRCSLAALLQPLRPKNLQFVGKVATLPPAAQGVGGASGDEPPALSTLNLINARESAFKSLDC